MNAGIDQYLRVFVNHKQDEWVPWLPLAEIAANNGISESTKCGLFYAVQGVDPSILFEGEPTQEQDQRQVNADQVQATIHQVHEYLQVELRRSQGIQEGGANRRRIPAPNIQVLSKVWLGSRKVRTTCPTPKWDSKRLRPFKLQHQVSPYACKLEIPALIRIHRVKPILLLDPVIEDPLEGQAVLPWPPVEVDGEEEYQMSSVEDCRMYQNQLQYLIRWMGYDSLTWEPKKFVDGLQAVGEFHQRYPG